MQCKAAVQGREERLMYAYNGLMTCTAASGQRRAERLAAKEAALVQRDAALQGGEERLRQEQALLAEGRAALERERTEARDMVKVGHKTSHRSVLPLTSHQSNRIWKSKMGTLKGGSALRHLA